MTQTLTQIRPSTTWFDRLLAGIIMFFAFFMIAGPGAANTSMIRELDASLGLIQRKTPYVVKNLGKILSFGSINAEAATTVLDVLRNTAASIEKAIRVAWNKSLSILIKKFVDSIFGLFNKIVGAIESWIDTLGALKDTVKSFFSALAMKVYALQECLVNKSSEVVSGLFGFDVPKENQGTQDACNQGSSGGSSFSTAGDFNIEGADFAPNSDVSFGDLQQITNAISDIRLGNLINFYSQQVVPGTEEKQGAASDKGSSTQNISGVVSKSQLEEKIDTVANTIAATQVAAGEKGSNPEDLSLGSGPASITNYRPDGVVKAAEAKQEIKKVLAQDQVAAVIAQQNTIEAAPADCKFNNFISETGASSGDVSYAPSNLNIASIEGYNAGFNPGSGTDFNFSNSANIVGQAANFDVNVLTAEQCKSAERISFTQTSAQAETGKTPEEGFSIDSLIDGLTQTLTDLVNNLISKVFNMLIGVVTKFLGSLPGGEFLSQAFTEALSGTSSAVQQGVTQIFNFYSDKAKKAI
jgi:hypothetical protein